MSYPSLSSTLRLLRIGWSFQGDRPPSSAGGRHDRKKRTLMTRETRNLVSWLRKTIYATTCPWVMYVIGAQNVGPSFGIQYYGKSIDLIAFAAIRKAFSAIADNSVTSSEVGLTRTEVMQAVIYLNC